MRLRFITFVPVAVFCVFGIMDDFPYMLCLQAQNKFEKFKTEKEISFLKQKVNDIYKQIGQKVYLNENTDSLINDLGECKKEILNMQKEIAVFHRKLKERIIFEKVLKKMSSTKGLIRRQAIRNLAKLNTNESLPYISMSLFDPDILVRREAAKTINALTDVTSDEAKTLIPNFKDVREVLQVFISTSTVTEEQEK